MSDYRLELRGAAKSFGSVRALSGIDLRLGHNEILALLGDNGAGKSTLIKAITGVHHLDEGQILIDDVAVSIKTPMDARRLGIETVYQDLAVFDNLDVVSNFFIGRERRGPKILGPLGLLRNKSMEQETRAHTDRLRVTLRSLNQDVGLMSGGQRQAIAVARAVAFASRIVILDEPTAALGLREAAQVLELVKRLPEHGISVILISHNMEHVAQVADRAMVMRQGRSVGEAIPSAENHERLVGLIVGAASLDPAVAAGNGDAVVCEPAQDQGGGT